MRQLALLIACALLLGPGAALAQSTTTGTSSARPAASAASPAAKPPATAAAPGAAPGAAPASQASKVNLNTASAQQLDALPQVGKARVKAIMDERAKGPFKDWADFDARMKGTSVNAGVKAKIKDMVSF